MSKPKIAVALATIAATSALASGVAAASSNPAGHLNVAGLAIAHGGGLGAGPGPHHCGTNTNPCPK
jgi:hypothetical protein